MTSSQIAHINRVLESLEGHRQAVYEAIDVYVGQMKSLGRSWVDSQGRAGRTFRDISLSLSDAVIFIIEKTDEIKAGRCKEGIDADQPKTETAPSSSASSSSATLPTSPLSSSSTGVARSSPTLTEHVLVKLQERVEVIESEMSTISETVDELCAVKTGMEDMKKVVQRCEETNTTTRGKLTTLKNRFEGLLGQFNTSAKDYNTNRSKDYNWFKKFEDKIGRLDENMHLLTGDVEEVEKKVKKSGDKLGEMEKKTSFIEERLSDVEKEKEQAVTKIKTIEEKMETCEAKLGDKIRCIEEERRDKDSVRMTEVEDRLSKLEEERMDVEIQRLGILEDRLMGVEEERRNDFKDFEDLKSQVSTLSSGLDVIEKRQEQYQAVGFVARNDNIITLSRGAVIKDLDTIILNKDSHYNQMTGEFTAPVDGLYLAAFSYIQWGSGNREINLYHDKVSTGDNNMFLCRSRNSVHNTSSSSVCLVSMTKGDKIYAKGIISGGDSGIFYPNFLCILIG